MSSIPENDLILPSLYLLANGPAGGLSTSDLIRGLEQTLKPSGGDLEILAGRGDSKFSQKVRNLTSHNTLTSQGLASRGEGRNAPFRITEKGRQKLLPHTESLQTLVDFSLDDSAQGLSELSDGKHIVVLDDRIVQEGELKSRTGEYRIRDRALREAAVKHYSKDGLLLCSVCDFDFSKAYPVVGNGYIQIHHLKPVSFMSGAGEAMNMNEALSNVRPLCANCHQIAHKCTPPIPIDDLRSLVTVSYHYQ